MPVSWLGKEYAVLQVNGQCLVGPPFGLPTPAMPYEVFCASIPECFGPEELIPFFSYAGEVYSLRLMVNFDGTSRGVAYVKYTTAEGARQAILMNGLQILQNRRLTVKKSYNVCSMIIRSISHLLDHQQVRRLLLDVSPVPFVDIEFSKTSKAQNAKLTFWKHEDAVCALRRLTGLRYMFGPNCFMHMNRVKIVKGKHFANEQY